LVRKYNAREFPDPFLTKGFTQREGRTKLESRKWLGKIFTAVSGERAEVNQELEDNAQLITEYSYGKGWMFKIRPDTMGERKNLMTDPGEIQEWPKKEIAEHGGK
jgi:glycine cleavage system H protein